MFKPAHELVLEAKKSFTESTSTDIQKKLTEPHTLLIDVRQPDEYPKGRDKGLRMLIDQLVVSGLGTSSL